jgi:hypothetical protein
MSTGYPIQKSDAEWRETLAAQPGPAPSTREAAALQRAARCLAHHRQPPSVASITPHSGGTSSGSPIGRPRASCPSTYQQALASPR